MFANFQEMYPNVEFDLQSMSSDNLKTTMRARAASGDSQVGFLGAQNDAGPAALPVGIDLKLKGQEFIIVFSSRKGGKFT